MEKSPDAFRTISEVADHLDTPAHVLRFWESRFPQIRPVKRAGGRRYYRPSDVALLAGIRRLLHDEGMTIRGVQKILREQGVRHVAGLTDEDIAADEGEIIVASPPPRKAAVARAPIPFPGPAAPPQAAASTPALPAGAAPAVAEPAQPAEAALPAEEPAPTVEAIAEAPPPEAAAPEMPPVAAPAPTQLALSLDDAAEDDAPDLLYRLRKLPRGALAGRAAQIAPLAERLRALADALSDRAQGPRP